MSKAGSIWYVQRCINKTIKTGKVDRNFKFLLENLSRVKTVIDLDKGTFIMTEKNQNLKVYLPSNTDWFAKAGYSLSVHWTDWTMMPLEKECLPFHRAVERFNLESFTEQVIESGASYFIFTVTHARQIFPGHNPIIESILPGRTTSRDLIREIAEALKHNGIKLILYYNHSCNNKDDCQWELASVYHASLSTFSENICAIVNDIAKRYSDFFHGWWFDSCYSVDISLPKANKSFTGGWDGRGFPWEELTANAKNGNQDILVCYNSGIDQFHLYTTHQDYWAGETKTLDLLLPWNGRYMNNGLQGHIWTCMEEHQGWGYSGRLPVNDRLKYDDNTLANCLMSYKKQMFPVTFNADIYQDGTINRKAITALKKLRTIKEV